MAIHFIFIVFNLTFMTPDSSIFMVFEFIFSTIHKVYGNIKTYFTFFGLCCDHFLCSLENNVRRNKENNFKGESPNSDLSQVTSRLDDTNLTICLMLDDLSACESFCRSYPGYDFFKIKLKQRVKSHRRKF